MSVTSLGISLDERDSIDLHADRSEETAWAVVRVDGAVCEIRIQRSHVEALGEQIPAVLAGLDRVVAEDAACARAGTAGERATDWAAKALDAAQMAEQAGAVEVAESLRAAAAEAIETANAVDAAVRAVDEAALSADRAADRLIYAVHHADTELCRVRDDDRPAALVSP